MPNTLAGTMGELRSSHFHTGIDIRTGGQEGLPVLAADEGYIFRISINPGGYGNAIYIKHPNGHTTVYAHLKNFREDIARYVRNQQYKKQVFKLNVFTEASTFKVKRGDLIGYSGNSGSSGGPHLHFDVRNRNQDLLNPLHYGFNEIIDTMPPVAKRLALVPASESSRINGCFERLDVPLRQNNGSFSPADTLYALGKVGLELFAYDRMNGTRFKTGINKIKVAINGQTAFITQIDTWPFSKSRQFYNYLNYEILANTGRRFHKLYINEGNTLDFYPVKVNNGYLTLHEGDIHNVEIELTDSYKNTSKVHFILKGGLAQTIKNQSPRNQTWYITGHTLALYAQATDSVHIIIDKKVHNLQADCTNSSGQAVFLWDMRKGIPDQLCINQQTLEDFFIKTLVPAGISYTYYHRMADIRFGKSSLFKPVYLAFEATKDTLTGFQTLIIGHPTIPLYKNITVTYKPGSPMPDKSVWGVYSVWGTSASYIRSNWTDKHITFKTNYFGSFKLLADSIPPTIKPQVITQEQLVFKITDNLSGIATINAWVSNHWVLMNYDPKKNLIWSEKKDKTMLFLGKVKLLITDNQGNEAIYETKL